MKCALSDIFWFIFNMVVTRRFETGAEAIGQDRPWLTKDEIRALILLRLWLLSMVRYWSCSGLSRLPCLSNLKSVTMHFLRLILLQLPWLWRPLRFVERELSSIGTSIMRSPQCLLGFKIWSLLWGGCPMLRDVSLLSPALLTKRSSAPWTVSGWGKGLVEVGY